jgi:hypothetical protein
MAGAIHSFCGHGRRDALVLWYGRHDSLVTVEEGAQVGRAFQYASENVFATPVRSLRQKKSSSEFLDCSFI